MPRGRGFPRQRRAMEPPPPAAPRRHEPAGTTMPPLPQRLVHDGPAARALLRRPARLHPNDRRTSFFRFVRQRQEEVPPRGVADAPMHALLLVVLDHVPDVEIFDADEAEPLDQRTSRLECMVLLLVRYTLPVTRGAATSPSSAFRAKRGFLMVSPVDSMANVVRPMSIPTSPVPAFSAGSGGTSSQENMTYHPDAFLRRVAVLMVPASGR